MKTWIAVVNRTEARIFECDGKTAKSIKLVEKLENPRGRLKNIDINADRPGFFAPPSRTSYPASMSQQQSPIERVAQVFALRISEALEKARNEHLYDDLILVAEPNFLGKVKGVLSRPTSQMLSRTLAKDLVNVPDHDIHKFIFSSKKPVLASRATKEMSI